MNIEHYIRMSAQMLAFRASTDEIHGFLIEEGLTEENAYLVFIAAKLLEKGEQ